MFYLFFYDLIFTGFYEQKRLSWSMDICSVDTPSCKDIDYTLQYSILCLWTMRFLNFRVGVYIRSIEASRPATTVYLTGRNIDMVPLNIF